MSKVTSVTFSRSLYVSFDRAPTVLDLRFEYVWGVENIQQDLRCVPPPPPPAEIFRGSMRPSKCQRWNRASVLVQVGCGPLSARARQFQWGCFPGKFAKVQGVRNLDVFFPSWALCKVLEQKPDRQRYCGVWNVNFGGSKLARVWRALKRALFLFCENGEKTRNLRRKKRRFSFVEAIFQSGCACVCVRAIWWCELGLSVVCQLGEQSKAGRGPMLASQHKGSACVWRCENSKMHLFDRYREQHRTR